MFRPSPRFGRRPVRFLPVLSCIPGEDVWFLRLALAFLDHLEQGGRIADRLRGRTAGKPGGPDFNFDHLQGGPLLWAPTLVRSAHFFIGHTVCPGFDKISSCFPWWRGTPFCVSGYDYLHDGLNYGHVPVDMAPHAFVPLAVSEVEAAAWRDQRQRSALIHGDPVEQAATYFARCRDHAQPAYNRLDGRPLADWTFRDYLFRHALPSYAKLFISYQGMAQALPDRVRIFGWQALQDRPADMLAQVLAHLTARRPNRDLLEQAVDLARREHIGAIEIDLGRRLDGSPARFRWHARAAVLPAPDTREPDLRRDALAFLVSLGVDIGHFPTPAPSADPVADDRDAGPAHRRYARLAREPARAGQGLASPPQTKGRP